MPATPLIETERLTLVRPDAEDAEEIFERYASDPEVTRYLAWPCHRTVDDTRGFLMFAAQEWDTWPVGPLLIRSRLDWRLLGSTGLSYDAPDRAVTGYVLAKDEWGQGFATEALRAMVTLASDLSVRELSAFVHPDHRASSRVAEKAGFTRDATWSAPAAFPNLSPDVQPVHRYVLTLSS